MADSNQAALEIIALEAQSLDKRLQHSSDYYTAKDGCITALTRVEKLKETIEAEKNNNLPKYLEWSGLDDLENLPLGKSKQLKCEKPLPTWTLTLATLFDGLDDAKGKDSAPYQDEKNHRNFLKGLDASTRKVYSTLSEKDLESGAGVHAISVNTALYSLKKLLKIEDYQQLSSQAVEDLIRHLWAMQYELCQPLFARTHLIHLKQAQTNKQLTQSLQEWLISEGGYKGLLCSHSVLAYLIASSIEQWIADTQTFITRFQRDRKQIKTLVGIAKIGKVTRIDDGLSDPHNGKQFVKRIWFGDKTGVIYKPRDVSSLEQLSKLLSTFFEHEDINIIKVPKCISKQDYGWIELIHREECISKKDVVHYYKHCGQLIAILYLTRTNDIHHENIIATRNQPLLIDTDTLFYPGFSDLSKGVDENIVTYAELAIEESVASSGVLPLWDDIHGLRDASAMGSLEANGQNFPTFDGEIQHPANYIDATIHGFRDICRAVLKHKNMILSELENFSSCSTRPLYRPTRIYETLRQTLRKPRKLIDGAARSIAIEQLKLTLLNENKKPQAWALIDEEANQIFSDDIPLFSIHCDQTKLKLSNGQTITFKTGLDIAKERLIRLDNNVIKYQEELIRASCVFSSEGIRPKTQKQRVPPLIVHAAANNQKQTQSKPRDQVFHETAALLIKELTHRSHQSPSFGASWIGINILEEYGKMQLSHAGLSLYNGNAGMALLYAASHHLGVEEVSKKVSSMDMSSQAVKPIQDLSLSSTQISNFVDAFGIGAMTGLGSLIYSCTACTAILNSHNTLDIANRLAQTVTPELIQKQTSPDVMSGLAGLLIALIELQKYSDCKFNKDRCIRIGDRICELLNPIINQKIVWQSVSGKTLLGLSHGAAGIAMALYRLFQLSGIERFKKAAHLGIDYENSNCDAKTGHWLDLRGETPAIMNSWCNGAPGIGLARLEMYKINPEPRFMADVQKAIDLITKDEETDVDQLCCGLLGHSDLLLSAGLHCKNQEWIELAFRIAKKAIDQTQETGRFRLLRALPRDISMPGLLQGTSGIAYQLLRLTNPNVLPSVLALSTNSPK